MSYVLIGSPASPYTRRIKLYLRDVPYTMEAVDYLSPSGDSRVSALNPIRRIPVLLADGKPIWESRIIFTYLQKAHGRAALSLDEENAVSSIDALQDQLIQLFLMTRLGPPMAVEHGYHQRAAERQRLILAFLEQELAGGRFQAWDYPALALYSMVDWAFFRDQLQRQTLGPQLQQFYDRIYGSEVVRDSDPRLS